MANAQRTFTAQGSGIWTAGDGSGVLVSLNGTGTMFTVYTGNGEHVVGDVFVRSDEPTSEAFARAVAMGRDV